MCISWCTNQMNHDVVFQKTVINNIMVIHWEL